MTRTQLLHPCMMMAMYIPILQVQLTGNLQEVQLLSMQLQLDIIHLNLLNTDTIIKQETLMIRIQLLHPCTMMATSTQILQVQLTGNSQEVQLPSMQLQLDIIHTNLFKIDTIINQETLMIRILQLLQCMMMVIFIPMMLVQLSGNLEEVQQLNMQHQLDTTHTNLLNIRIIIIKLDKIHLIKIQHPLLCMMMAMFIQTQLVH